MLSSQEETIVTKNCRGGYLRWQLHLKESLYMWNDGSSKIKGPTAEVLFLDLQVTL